MLFSYEKVFVALCLQGVEFAPLLSPDPELRSDYLFAVRFAVRYYFSVAEIAFPKNKPLPPAAGGYF